MADDIRSHLGFKNYVEDAAHMRAYAEYQKKYARTIRESDKVLIELLRARAAPGARLLDLGCSTGNLLLHLKHALPGIALAGGDIVGSIIAANRENPELAGIEFLELDMLALPAAPQYDVVVTNAALMFFAPEEFQRAIASIGRAVRPGGWFLAFDLFHPFEQEIDLIETSSRHPSGLRFHFRSYQAVRRALDGARLSDPEFAFFSMPIALPRPLDPSDITSYTVETVEQQRLSFRGALYQPWCHLSARKKT